MKCYVKNFGVTRLAVCEAKIARGAILTVTEQLHGEPTETLWARLGALLGQAGEVVEAQ